MHLFANDSSLFSCVDGVQQTQDKLIKDLQTIIDWAHQWKMALSPDVTKQAIEVIVSWCWLGTRCEKLFDQLGWESFSQRWWSQRLTMYYKIANGMTPYYLFDYIPGNSTINVSLHNKIT